MKAKRTKKYQGPKYVAKNPITTFFGGLSGDHADHLARLLITNHGAMNAIVEGRGSRDEFDRLAGALNMAKVMCDQGIGAEFKQIMIDASIALLEMGMRALRTNRFVFTGDELRIMNEALESHDAQLENIRAIDVDRACDEVIRRVRHRINSTSVRAEFEKEKACAEQDS